MEPARPSYRDIRPLIRTGDCILWKGRGLVSRLIMLWTEFSHASAVVRFSDISGRVYIVEAVESGVELRLLSERIRDYDGAVHLFRPDHMTDVHRAAFRVFCVDAVAQGIRYDYGSLLKNILGRTGMDAKRYFCSELYWDALVRCGYADPTPKAPRPGDIPKWVPGELTRITPDA